MGRNEFSYYRSSPPEYVDIFRKLSARRNLLAEGLHPRRIMHTGSPMPEVLETYRPRIEASDVLHRLGLADGGYFLVSAHRAESVDDPDRLRMLLDCLTAVRSAWGLPVHVTTHPRTRKRLAALPGWTEPADIVFHGPFGFDDYNRLQLGAACVLSDSGTIAEEAAILDFPAVTLRESIDRPEAVDAGGIVLTRLDPRDVVDAVRLALARRAAPRRAAAVPADYAVADTADRVVSFVDLSNPDQYPERVDQEISA